MTVHPFRSRADSSGERLGPAFDDDADEFPYDFHIDFDTYDDTDAELTRFGSIDRQYRYAHRTISAPMLAMVSGIQVPVCQALHYVLFALLEDVGDFDGLIAAPSVVVVGRDERLAPALDWLAEHPPPDVVALLEADDADDQPDDHIAQLVRRHSLGLAAAAGCNPSLTLGSVAALQDRLVDEVLEVMWTCQVDEIDRLADAAVALLSRLPDSIRLVGGATVERAAGPLPLLSV